MGSATCAWMTPTRSGRQKYVDAIQEDIHWLGFDWGDRFYFASDYFPKMYGMPAISSAKGLPMSVI